MQGFKEFIMRGNLVQTAVAFIIGTAFATVVSTFTNVLLSVIALVLGGREPNFDNWAPGGIPVGTFLTALISFLMVAAVIYFAVVKPMNALMDRLKKGEEEDVPPSETELLTEIRDLLASNGGAKPSADASQA
ncbi:large conductance mechanosensitive channel protein MscL [Propionibacterium australiense]|uniref:Bacterial mechano-sensitive ion channel signature n=1 Tax=Propionibacterium australiense TaxID=119981 RepID=A0A383S8Z5_9ACTN|nr:large conductance mechanosensitive channel protein MscL [Propionibacterium australiense]RLP09487.1 large conductance mechanosensitive channel protein MscL [Propionibacterium australiense]RLP09935.1 large conductance mechanosensitive channel protein MscL [Propionibacterium australiense]SYZ33849.1 Bacterial mechano-sensitive ion channel signature [Propionibacterium australiense]VEH92016.1 Large-conductance mechanosensitive channel [Propionibacterium australiense]